MVATPVAGNNENEKKYPSNQQATVNTYTNLFLLMIRKNNKEIYTDIQDCKLGMTCLQ